MNEKQAIKITKECEHKAMLPKCQNISHHEARVYLEAIEKVKWFVKNVAHHHVCEVIETGKEGSCDICRVVGKWYDDK